MAIILAIGLILFINAYSKKEAFSQINLWGGKETTITSDNKDTDNDGLKDWEENLYKTDPLNPDTDADGYLDGEEINSGHNPLLKSPGDSQVFHPLPLGDKYNLTQKVLTDEFIDSTINSYMTQKNDYLTDHPSIDSAETFSASIDKSTIQEMWQRALSDNYPILLEKAEQILTEMPEIFNIIVTDNDIVTSEKNDKETINLYISKVSSIFDSENFFLKDQVLQDLSSAMETNDFSKIDASILANDIKIEKAKQIIVPSSWKEIHREGLRLILLIRNIFVSIRGVTNDPIKAYVAIDKLNSFSKTWNELMNNAIDLAKSQGIEINFQK
jgi:hypothetical protein